MCTELQRISVSGLKWSFSKTTIRPRSNAWKLKYSKCPLLSFVGFESTCSVLSVLNRSEEHFSSRSTSSSSSSCPGVWAGAVTCTVSTVACSWPTRKIQQKKKLHFTVKHSRLLVFVLANVKKKKKYNNNYSFLPFIFCNKKVWSKKKNPSLFSYEIQLFLIVQCSSIGNKIFSKDDTLNTGTWCRTHFTFIDV